MKAPAFSISFANSARTLANTITALSLGSTSNGCVADNLMGAFPFKKGISLNCKNRFLMCSKTKKKYQYLIRVIPLVNLDFVLNSKCQWGCRQLHTSPGQIGRLSKNSKFVQLDRKGFLGAARAHINGNIQWKFDWERWNHSTSRYNIKKIEIKTEEKKNSLNCKGIANEISSWAPR